MAPPWFEGHCFLKSLPRTEESDGNNEDDDIAMNKFDDSDDEN